MSVVFINFEEDDPNFKINRCKHRSEKKEETVVKKTCCGGSKKMLSFKCNERKIFLVDRNICEKCSMFSQK